MAKKKEQELSYMQVPLPSAVKAGTLVKRVWNGLNLRHQVDSNMLSESKNISTDGYPFLEPSMKWRDYATPYTKGEYKHPLSMTAFDDLLAVVYLEEVWKGEPGVLTGYDLKVDYLTSNDITYTGLLKRNITISDKFPRCIVQFNLYDDVNDALRGEYDKRLLFFPDLMSAPLNVGVSPDCVNDAINQNGYDSPLSIIDRNVINQIPYGLVFQYVNTETNELGYYRVSEEKKDDILTKRIIECGVKDSYEKACFSVDFVSTMPPIKYATVHNSRVFGVDDSRIFASAFNNYENWDIDTEDEYNEANAWVSPAQSNVKAGSSFTSITTYQGHVITFKRNFMHEIYNTKNPFRVVDVYAEGTIDNRSVCEVDGKLIFVSSDDVKIYTGSNPRVISYNLGISNYEEAVSGTDGRHYYLYCESPRLGKKIFVYDTYTEQWTEQVLGDKQKVLSFGGNEHGMYALCEDGWVYKIDTDDYSHDWSFETDLITNQTVNIKHIKKLQMLFDVGEKTYVEAETTKFKVYILYDDETFNPQTSHLVYEYDNKDDKSKKVVVRVLPRNTAHYGFKLHIEGYGYVRIYELEMALEGGGNKYVSEW